MARKRVSAPRRSSTKSSQSDQSTSSMPATGIFGHLHTGSIIQCDAKDNSFFCMLSKGFSAIMMILTLIIIFYFIYIFANIYMGSGKRR